MRASIKRGVRGAEIERAIPRRYAGIADPVARRADQLTVVVFPDDGVVTSADVARVARRISGAKDHGIAFVGEATVEALVALAACGVRCFALRSFGWTDERYRAIRQRSRS